MLLSLASLLLVSVPESVSASQPKGLCLLPPDAGPCRGDVARYFYSAIGQRCERFGFGGCAGNANNFATYAECHKACWKIPKIPRVCRFPKDEGPCRAILKKYFFNMTSMQCEPFFYGGCRGNENRFSDLESCTEYCSPRKTIPIICLEPLDTGRCSASIPRYYYNSATKMCTEFLYSGCGGSNNNFDSKQSCKDVCSKGRPRRLKKKPFIKI
ncbi:tissue factor pathway inhibitor 2 isoform X2 [Denticeps clupeoides]|uniref:tissue factor pathway inhibitor 2 isoform X2 n=1 Tax=Denticeps clupeoides TaxID=299321 RepID=UPI0010A4F5BF|nr:tissue factor pathway inhibitor 2 isoform X2 [Denticeps clupeoides]